MLNKNENIEITLIQYYVLSNKLASKLLFLWIFIDHAWKSKLLCIEKTPKYNFGSPKKCCATIMNDKKIKLEHINLFYFMGFIEIWNISNALKLY